MRKLFASLMLTGVLMAPAIMSAKDDHDRDNRRYYDSDRRDYHQWNNDEDRAYRHWIQEERHERYRNLNRLSKKEQREYWRWRHEHSDWH